MTTGPITFTISDRVGVLGTLVKQNVDVPMCYFDFANWLDTGETLTQMTNFAISTVAASYGWQADFPFPTASSSPIDTNPLTVSGSAVTSTTKGRISVSDGTPGLSYVVSFIAKTSLGRQKEIDIQVTVNQATNSNMISSTAPTNTVTNVAGTAALAEGTAGSVYINNVSGAVITVTLPTNPLQGQRLDLVDVGGNATTYPITVQGAAGATVGGLASVVMGTSREALSVEWNGSGWSIV